MLKRIKWILLFYALFYSISFSSSLSIEKNIANINWHKIINNVLEYYHTNNITPQDLEKYTHEYGHLYLYLLAEIETDLNQITGKRNKHDKGTFQINVYWWSYNNLSALSGKNIASEKDILDNEVYLAAHIWLYNICIYRNKYGVYPINTVEVLAVYHNPNKLNTNYIKRINVVLQRNNINIINF